MTRLVNITIDAEPGGDCRAAMDDLAQENNFALLDLEGPYDLHLAMREGRVVFAVSASGAMREFHLSLGPFRQVVKDYFQICDSLIEAKNRLPADRIEAIDMARRGIHNEGARIVQERLAGKAQVDLETARRLFTLICAMQR
ncbi:UPF0262 family protein [Falsirhodobacter deserti]|uniref:UPF0262 family protein n=1 Tax=Falsirhodobacter deserti TaxID=1365611 RepID=UPI000FE3BC1B